MKRLLLLSMILASLVVAFYGFALFDLLEGNPSYGLLFPPFLITSLTLIGLLSVYHEKAKWIFILAGVAFLTYLILLGPFRFWVVIACTILIGALNAFPRKRVQSSHLN